jgi:hypothetical protein
MCICQFPRIAYTRRLWSHGPTSLLCRTCTPTTHCPCAYSLIPPLGLLLRLLKAATRGAAKKGIQPTKQTIKVGLKTSKPLVQLVEVLGYAVIQQQCICLHQNFNLLDKQVSRTSKKQGKERHTIIPRCALSSPSLVITITNQIYLWILPSHPSLVDIQQCRRYW